MRYQKRIYLIQTFTGHRALFCDSYHIPRYTDYYMYYCIRFSSRSLAVADLVFGNLIS